MQQKGAALDAVVVIIPVFNEGTVIAEVISELAREFSNIVVVDDCSSDDSAELAEASGAVVIRHPINLGQGAAIQTGIDYALTTDCQVIVTFDGDGQHSAADIAALVDPIVNGKTDFSLGSRFLGHAVALPWLRRIVLKAAVFFTIWTTGLRLTDAHNGIRGMSRRGARALCIRQNRMAHASEILGQIARSGLNYVEVPVSIVYTSYSLAKGQKLSNSIYILIDLIAARLVK